MRSTSYDVRGDMDVDGDVDSTDKGIAMGSPFAGSNIGYDFLSMVGSSRGMGGYRANAYQSYDVRMRDLLVGLGRWSRRDPAEYVDGGNLYEYVRSSPLAYIDPSGLLSASVVSVIVGECGGYHIDWEITLSGGRAQDVCGSLTGGYIVQHIKFNAAILDCFGPASLYITEEYWELFRLGPFEDRVQDTWGFEPNLIVNNSPKVGVGTYGALRQIGTAKFYCDPSGPAVVGPVAAGPPSFSPMTRSLGSQFNPPGAGGHHPWSGGHPSTTVEPPIWQQPADEGPHTRAVYGGWNCCNAITPTHLQIVNP